MNVQSKLLGAAILACAALLISARAQSEQTASDSEPKSSDAGLLGRTYASADLNFEAFRNYPDSPAGWGPALGINLPASDHFDYNLSYAFEHGKSAAFKFTGNTLANGATYYYKSGYVSPFVTAGFGYAWNRSTEPNLPARFDHMFYDAATGLEFPLTKAASLRATVMDDQSFRRPHERDFDYGLSANYWLGSVIGTYVGATVKDGRGGALNSTEYTVGVRFSLD